MATESGDGGTPATTAPTSQRPLITPEPFSGTGMFSEWIEHFEAVAAINKWDEAAKLLWLRVRLVGGAQTAYGRLPTEAKESYVELKKALKGRFEPEALKERHLAQFQARKKTKTEGWAEFADAVKLLCDKAYPDLEEKARECLALNHYLGQIDNPQIAFSVRQRQPKTLMEAVSGTIEMESYLQPKPSRIAQVEPEPAAESVIAAIQNQQTALLGALDKVMEHLEKLEAKAQEPPKGPPAAPRGSSGRRPVIVCRKCHREGHYARGCASQPLPSGADRQDPEPMSLLPVTHSYRLSGTVNGVPTTFVVDTGASITVLDETLWEKTHRGECSLEPWTGRRLVGVEGTPLHICGVSNVELKFAGETFHCPVLVARSLTSEAILGLDFLEANNCTLEMADRKLTFPERGVAVSLYDSSPDPELLQARVTIDETLTIPPFSMLETMARVNGKVRGQTWLLQECRTKQLPVKIANGLVNSTCDQVPVRVLNPSPDSRVVYKGTKIATVEGVNDEPRQTILAVQPEAREVSRTKRQALSKMMEKCASDLGAEQKEQLLQLLIEFADIFADEGELGRTDRITHNIDTGSAPLIRQPVRRVPVCQKAEIKDLLADMEKKDVIRPSNSPWASPIVLVRKRDGSHRFCVDYRKLNAVTRKDAYPIPRIDDTLDTLSGACWFSTLDMVSGYWQVEVGEKDREKTAFCTPYGLYEFNVLPFGLCNGPATFQRLMDLVLSGLQMSQCLVYIDDVIVVGRTFDEHLCNLREVFGRVRGAGLKLKPSKCAFLQERVYYLGHEVSRKGVATDPTKINQVAHWPVPQSVKDVQKFLGLASYYRRFVRNFASIAKPLHRLTEKTATFEWTVECQAAFAELRHKLCTAPVLAFPDFTKPFILDTDASNTGIGGVLSQLDEQGQEHVIAFASRTLSKSERRYCVTRRELLAVVVFTQQFRPYLLGREFTLRTDHSSLSWLQSFKEPEGQLARWLEKLQEFHFRILHRPGKKHTNADAMSRRPCDQCGRIDEDSFVPQSSVDPEENSMATVSPIVMDASPVGDGTPAKLRQLQLDDSDIKFVLEAKESDTRPADDVVKAKSTEVRKLVQIWDQLVVANGVLKRRFEDEEGQTEVCQWVVPKKQRKEILHHLHDGPLGAHLGEKKILQKLKERFYWPGHATDVRNWCHSCEPCAQRKTPIPKPRAPLVSIQVGHPMQLVATDIVGPFPESTSGNSYVLVAADYFTRWVEAYPIPCQEAAVVAKKLVDEMFCRFSPPEQLLSDQGRQFESQLLAEVCKIMGIQKSRTTPYHPQCDGLVERWNRTLLQSLATSVSDHPENWDEFIQKICMAYNTSVHPTTGFTPFFLMFGRQAKLPVDLLYGTPEPDPLPPSQYAATLKTAMGEAYEKVRTKTTRQLKHQSDLYNQKVHGNPYKVGDFVWVLFPQTPRGKSKKLYRPWKGPFVVAKKLSDITYRVQEVTNRRRRLVIHFNRLKPFRGTVSDRQPQQQEPRPSDGHMQGEEPKRHYFGSQLELAEEDSDTPALPSPPELNADPAPEPQGEVQNASRRYPQRARQPPNRFSQEYS